MRQHDIFESIYLCLLILYSLLREVIPAQNVIGNSTLIVFLFVLGLLIITRRLMSNKSTDILINNISLICFIFVCVISAAINYKYSFTQNVKAICWLILYFGFCYVYGYELRDKKLKKIIGGFAFISLTVLCAISLPMYYLDIDYTSINRNVIGTVSNQGFSLEYMRLWGVFADPNTGAIYTLIAISIGVWLMASCRRRWLVILIPSEFILFSYFVLSGSRTAFLAMLVGVAFAVAGVIYRKTNRKIILSCIGGILGIILVLVICGVIKACLPHVKSCVKQTTTDITQKVVREYYDKLYIYSGVEIESGLAAQDDGIIVNDNSAIDSDQATEIIERDDLKEKNDVSNGRFAIWKDSVRLFLKAPLFGTSPRGASEFGKDYCPDNCISQWGYSAHNSWLELLMCTGIIGLLVMSYIVFSSMFRGLKVFSFGDISDDILCMSVAWELIVASMLLSDLFFVFTFGGVLFWFVVGAMNSRYVQVLSSCNKGKNRNRILIYGPKDPVGGVENIVFEYVRNIVNNHQDISFDYLE